jgi:hypothetical protein
MKIKSNEGSGIKRVYMIFHDQPLCNKTEIITAGGSYFSKLPLKS